MGASVTRNDGTRDERAVLDAFAREGLRPQRWSNAPGDTYAPHSHDYHKVLFCLDGSITFRLIETGEDVDLEPGDRLDIEPETVHAATVGPHGVVCAEAAR